MASYIVRSELPVDHSQIFDVNVQAFGEDEEARLINTLRDSGAFDPALSIVADHNDTVIGHILFPPVTIESPDGDVPALALALLSVHPDFQGQGIGSALVEEGLRECRRLGNRICIVVGHPLYYPHFGFMSGREQGISVEFPCPDEALMALSLVPGALDGVGGMVRYHPALSSIMEN
ncbi:MAG: N-acetyltransferase [Methanoregula sp.]|jgi:putative acetyltransferase